MSVKVLSAVWDHSRASGTPLIVLLCLADWANDDGECWPSISAIAKKARLKDERHVKRVIHETLEKELGEVVVIPGGGRASSKGGLRSNRYRIVVHMPDEMVAEQPPSDVDDSGSPTTQMVAEQPPRMVAEQPPEPSVEPLVEPPSLSGEVVHRALTLIADRVVERERRAGNMIRNGHAYRAKVMADPELVGELTKRHAANPAWSAEDLALMFEPRSASDSTPDPLFHAAPLDDLAEAIF